MISAKDNKTLGANNEYLIKEGSKSKSGIMP
jgi:hypothetical protein